MVETGLERVSMVMETREKCRNRIVAAAVAYFVGELWICFTHVSLLMKIL